MMVDAAPLGMERKPVLTLEPRRGREGDKQAVNESLLYLDNRYTRTAGPLV